MYLIGIDVGGMSIKGGAVTQNGEIIFKTAIATTEKYTAGIQYQRRYKKVIDLVVEGANISLKDVKGIGIGQPGSIDSKKGIIRYSNNIALERVPVVDELKKVLRFTYIHKQRRQLRRFGRTRIRRRQRI